MKTALEVVYEVIRVFDTHGESDETVPVDEARVLADQAPETARLKTIARGSHTFGATHPFDGPTPQLITALNLTQHWFRTTLCD